jgi:hypothetical protein
MKLLKIYIVLLLLVFAAGCKEEIRHRINFYHFLHVEEYEIECTMCHGEMSEGMFASADMDICVECHEDEVDADEINSETCGKCHLEKDLESIEPHDYERPTRGVFRHSEALSGSCRLCHVDTVKEGSTKVAFWTRDDVIAIRNRAHTLDFDCKTCHENINKDTPWDNHKTDWINRHKIFAAEEKPLCTQCHIQENCRECHQQQAPSSHINSWTGKLHGIEATWGRESCQVCHQDDFCFECHLNNPPTDHNIPGPNNPWRSVHGVSGDLIRCDACHTSESCSECHAVTKPNSHVAGWLPSRIHCSNCHFEASNCSTCHARSANEIHDAIAPVIPAPGVHSVSNECLNGSCHVIGGLTQPVNQLPKATHDIFDESECLTCHQR